MKKIRTLCLVALVILVNTNGIAQKNYYQQLNGYLEIAAQNNPEMKAYFNRYMASLEKVPQLGSLPDPQASLGYFIKPMELLGGNQLAEVQLMQMFPWFGTLKVARDEASMMAKAKFESFNTVKADLFYKVKSSWYQLMKLDREITLLRENIELLETLEKLALVKFQSPDEVSNPGSGSMDNTSPGAMNTSTGEMSGMNNQQNSLAPASSEKSKNVTMAGSMGSRQVGLQEVLRVRMEILEQKNQLALLTDQRRTEEIYFNALLNRNLELNVQITDSLVKQILPENKAAVADSILRNNPMLSMLETENDAYGLMEQKAKKMGLPMLGLGLNYMVIQKREENTSMMNGKDMLMPMISISIPVYRKKYNSMQKEAQLMQEAGNQQIIELKNDLQVQYHQFIQNLDDAGRRMSLYKEQEDLARKTTDLLITGFATTGNDYEEVLRMQVKVLDYGFKYIEAIVDYNTSIALAEKLMNSVKF
jgi:outer membrane protein TolC